jgi:tetratricopeptide (TPR) repeat protein
LIKILDLHYYLYLKKPIFASGYQYELLTFKELCLFVVKVEEDFNKTVSGSKPIYYKINNKGLTICILKNELLMTKVWSICLFLLFNCYTSLTIIAQPKDMPTTKDSSFVNKVSNKYFVKLPDNSPKPNSEELMKEAIVHFDAARYSTCLKYLNKAVEINEFPQLTDILYFYRAVCLTKTRDFSNAITDYNAAISVNAENHKYIYHRGITYFQLGNYKKAQEDFEKTMVIQGPDADLYLKLGFIKEYRNKTEGSITDYSKAIELNPKLAEAYYYRGLQYLRVFLREEACKDLAKATELGYPAAEKEYENYCGSK